MEDVKSSPFQMFGIEADEGTDSSNSSFIIVYIRFIDKHGDVTSRYLAVKGLEATTSEYIFEAIHSILSEKGLLDSCSFVALATDGCSTMMGTRKGVTTRQIELILYLFKDMKFIFTLML